ncbi:hypothetical protein [Mycobacterium shottsii]|nr:hypothetical protein [Mycobacterium shottsii]
MIRRVIAEAGHFPWIEQPVAVRDAFTEVAQRIIGAQATGSDRRD